MLGASTTATFAAIDCIDRQIPKANATAWLRLPEEFLKFSKEKRQRCPFPFDGQDATDYLVLQDVATMKHLNTDERYTIQHMHEQGKSCAAIALHLQRSKTTIARELKRNALDDGSYAAAFALTYAAGRKAHKNRRNAMTPEVIKTLEQGLEKRLSPEQIIGRSEVENTPMPCIQTAYNYIHKQRKKGRLLHKKLRHRGRKRKARGQSTKTRGTIPGRRDISERPPEVEKRQRFGDFECDLVIGAEHSGALLTINERATGLLWMLKLKDKQASSVREGIISLLRPIKDRVYTITSDNGKEFASHREISEVLECEYYFARPYHSWERGSNENLNGLIRDYFPKKTTFYDITPSAVKTVQEALNNRPRKRYKFLSPTEFYTQNFNQLDTRCVCN